MKIPEGKIRPKYFQIFKKYLKRCGITVAEWHSLVIGVGAALIGGTQLAIGVWTTATSAKKAKGHMKDLKNEIGYFVGSFILTEAIISSITYLTGIF